MHVMCRGVVFNMTGCWYIGILIHMKTERNNNPLWLVFSLITLGALVTFIAYMIQVDGQIDDIRSEPTPAVDIEVEG